MGCNLVQYGLCSYEGDYTASSQLLDGIVRGSLGRRIPSVWAVGNERVAWAACERYFALVPPPATAKNTITVGATNSDIESAPEVGSLADFSSPGPTDDGRLRPDLVAPGCETVGDHGITSTSAFWSGEEWIPLEYSVHCGTSMAAPVVTGVIALMLEEWKSRYTAAPLPSTIKAILLNTATDLASGYGESTFEGPDYRSGYGLVNRVGAVDVVRDGHFLEDEISYGEEVLRQAP
jgi:subtilisin family serine protease